MTEFFIFYAFSVLISAVSGLKPMTLMQSDGYRIKPSARAILSAFTETALIAATATAYIAVEGNLRFIGAVLFFLIMLGKIVYDWAGTRLRPNFTNRFRRLLTVYSAVISAVFLPIGLFCETVGKFQLFAVLSVYPATAVALILTAPFEKLNSAKYVERAKRFFENSVGITKIGITGSAGKTSVKNILSAVLSKKYTVISTEKNFNTPLGIARTVAKYRGEQIFIAEMGARKTGDIKELCEIVRPDIGIVTAVLPQHLETFGSVDNVAAEKGELPKRANLFSVLNIDDERVSQMEVSGKRITVGEGGDCFVKSAEFSIYGTKFVYADSSGEYEMSLPLAGKFTAQNAALAIAVARELGVSIEDIRAGLREMKQIPHRLEVSENAAGITIVDDAYNSNVLGAKAALELLAETSGRKIVVAQGVVEMGKERESANREIGAAMAKLGGAVIFTGINAKYLSEGYFANGGQGETYFAKNLDGAREIFSKMLRRGDIVFFQNDIPDNY